MTHPIDASAWSATLLGLYVLFVGIGALRSPNAWNILLKEIGESPALQILCGLLELTLGALVYIVNPWAAGDVLSCVLKALGGLMMIEALVITAFSDFYTHLILRTLRHAFGALTLAMIVFGAVLLVAGLMRFGLAA